MTKPTNIELAVTAFEAKSKRSKLAQRFDHSVFVNVDLMAFPPEVVQSLLVEAIQTKCRAAVKKLDAETCTEDQIKLVMAGVVEKIKSGKSAGATAKPKMTEEQKAIRARARSLLRQAFEDAHDDQGGSAPLDSKVLTSIISERMKERDKFTTNPSRYPEFAESAELVNAMLRLAEQSVKMDQEASNKVKGSIAVAMAAPAPAKKKAPTAKKAPSAPAGKPAKKQAKPQGSQPAA